MLNNENGETGHPDHPTVQPPSGEGHSAEAERSFCTHQSLEIKVGPGWTHVIGQSLQLFLDRRSLPPGVWEVPQAVVISHFINPLRSLQSLRHLFATGGACEVFKTPNSENSDWCVLEPNDSEVLRAQKEQNARHPAGLDEQWEYSLSQPSFEDGEWHHSFSLERSSPTHAARNPEGRDYADIGDRMVPSSTGWMPEKSGVLMLLHDVCLGADICERVPRREMLRGLARHIVGKSSQGFCFLPGSEGSPATGEVGTLQRSAEGIMYFIYSVGDFGPTHIFTERER